MNHGSLIGAPWLGKPNPLLNQSSESYDVAIIGTGIAGSALGAILARQGQRVILFEGKSHPRFAIGESMILETSETLRAMAELYDVPELAYFSSENYFSYIGTSHGVKRHFSYLHHVEGRPHDLDCTLQAVIPKQPHGHELASLPAGQRLFSDEHGHLLRRDRAPGNLHRRCGDRRGWRARQDRQGRDVYGQIRRGCRRLSLDPGRQVRPAHLRSAHPLARPLHPHGRRARLSHGRRQPESNMACPSASPRARCTMSSRAAGSG